MVSAVANATLKPKAVDYILWEESGLLGERKVGKTNLCNLHLKCFNQISVRFIANSWVKSWMWTTCKFSSKSRCNNSTSRLYCSTWSCAWSLKLARSIGRQFGLPGSAAALRGKLLWRTMAQCPLLSHMWFRAPVFKNSCCLRQSTCHLSENHVSKASFIAASRDLGIELEQMMRLTRQE